MKKHIVLSLVLLFTINLNYSQEIESLKKYLKNGDIKGIESYFKKYKIDPDEVKIFMKPSTYRKQYPACNGYVKTSAVYYTPMLYAIEKNRVNPDEVIKKLVELGASYRLEYMIYSKVTSDCHLEDYTNIDYTPLEFAKSQRNYKAISALKSLIKEEIMKKEKQNKRLNQIKKKEEVPEGFVKDFDGNVYPTIIIDDMEWMAKNLKVTHFPNGFSIKKIDIHNDRQTWRHLKWNNEGDAYFILQTNNPDYGALYTYAAVIADDWTKDNSNIYGEGGQGICPDGWHVPTIEEWVNLINYLGGSREAGGKMKEKGTANWKEPNITMKENSGFNALPSGFINPNGYLYDFGSEANLWSATESEGAKNAYAIELTNNSTHVKNHNLYKSCGLAVRCVRKSKKAKNQNSLLNKYDTVSDIDGNIYPTVKIGNQTWMAKDLRVSHYPNGKKIPYISYDNWKYLKNDDKEDFYGFYKNDSKDDYGALYTYAAAIGDNWKKDHSKIKGPGGQGVCPDGWRLPTIDDWETLIQNLGGEEVAGGKLKEKGLKHWEMPNEGATNSSGFTALPMGSTQHSFSRGVLAYYRTANPRNKSESYFYYLDNGIKKIIRKYNNKSIGMYVRCIKEEKK